MLGRGFWVVKRNGTNIEVTTQTLYRSGTVNSNTVNSKFHLIRSYCEIVFYNFPNISCLKYAVNSNFHLIRSKTLPTNDFELTVPDLYHKAKDPVDLSSASLVMAVFLASRPMNNCVASTIIGKVHLHNK